MNKLFLDQDGYIELLRCIRRLYERTNMGGADTNTTYTLSLEGNNLKLTPSSGEAQTIDLSSLKGSSEDTNTTYTLSLEGNNLKLTPSSGEAQAIDLSSLKGSSEDTNTTYTLSLEGNNLKLTPSSGEAQTIDLSSLIKSIVGNGTGTGVYGGRFSVMNDTVEELTSGTGNGDMGFAQYTYTIPTEISNIHILNVTAWDTTWRKISDAHLYEADGAYNINYIDINDDAKQITITTASPSGALIKDFYISYIYTIPR